MRDLNVTQLLHSDVDPAELWSEYLVAAKSEELGAYLSLRDGIPTCFDSPLSIAPLAVKDLFCTKDFPTTAASLVLQDFNPGYDATAVKLVQAAGIETIGKTNMDEFAMGGSNEYSAYGVVHNPLDFSRVAGGSSGGSAAAVAGGLAAWALGSDTGGSVRQPASFCGIVGFKPSYGAISRFGMIATASSLDQCGVLTRSVSDARLLTSILAKEDERDMTCLGESIAKTSSPKELDGVRIGVCRSWIEAADHSVTQVINQALSYAREAGAILVDVELPHVDAGVAAYYIIVCAEASSNLARYDGVRYAAPASQPETLEELYLNVRSRFGLETQRRIMLGTHVLSAGYAESYYQQAVRARAWIADDFSEVFKKVDVVATPTAPTTAYCIGTLSRDPVSMYMGDVYTVSPSLAGIPAISIPAGYSQDLPVGLQLVGPRHGDDHLLSHAHSFEALLAGVL